MLLTGQELGAQQCYTWVLGHSRSSKNERADMLIN